MIQWDVLTPEQKDRLVAEKVMGWKPALCAGEIGEKPISPDGWYCLQCGYDGYWGDDQEHEERPAPYSTNLDIAWTIVEKLCDQHLEVFTIDDWWQHPRKEMCEIICKAGLRAVGMNI